MTVSRRLFVGAGLVMLTPLNAVAGTRRRTSRNANEDEKFAIDTPELWRVPSKYRKRLVRHDTGYAPGTLVVDTENKFLYLQMERRRSLRYGIGVGRAGFSWNGSATIARKAKWPGWTPPAAMRRRQPYLPRHMPGGPNNPLGARALYLYQNGRDTLYRIHGTNEPESIGKAMSSGCIRMVNEDAADLYLRVPVGAKVVVI